MADIHSSCKKRQSFAWAKYYESFNQRLDYDFRHYGTLTQTLKKDIGYVLPQHLHNEIEDMAKELKKTWTCPICLDFIKPGDLQITICGHFFCKGCLGAHKTANSVECKCPVCRHKII